MSWGVQHAPLVVLGAGPGGYPTAFAAADAGIDVTLVDDGYVPGGTCLRHGCIPSKALLHVARGVREAAALAGCGVEFGAPRIDLERLRAWKDELIAGLGGGVSGLATARKIKTVVGRGVLSNQNTLDLSGPAGEAGRLEFERLVVATGSVPICPATLAIDDDRVMDSSAALELSEIPDRMLVVGGGYIGLELGSVYAALGSRITVVEMEAGLLPGADRDLVRPLARSLAEQFESIRTQTSVGSLEARADGIEATLVSDSGEHDLEQFDRVLVAVGRRPNTADLGLQECGVELQPGGQIVVDEHGRTNVSHILAVGDVCDGPMLAHKASNDARRVVEALKRPGVDDAPAARSSAPKSVIPAVIFTDPELAWCGLTEVVARNEGRQVSVARMPWSASGRAQSLSRPDGLSKLVFDPVTGQVLGVGLVGVGAGELIAEGVLAVQQEMTVEMLGNVIHPHPTLSETISEAAEHAQGRAIHMLPRRDKR